MSQHTRHPKLASCGMYNTETRILHMWADKVGELGDAAKDVQLFMAAPDLLAACKELIGDIRTWASTVKEGSPDFLIKRLHLSSEVVGRIEDLIAKAEGSN